jgi:hypothetical protein
MNRYRRTPEVDEPLTMTADDVIRQLERLGYDRMAGYVSRLANGVADANREKKFVEQQLHEALKRLHEYEPPQRIQTNYLPRSSAESDG